MAIGAFAVAATAAAGAAATVGGDDARLPAYQVDERVVETKPEPPTPRDDLTWPVRGEVTGQFGEPRGGRAHEGIDIPLPEGTPIKAASDGKVVMREDESGYGKYTCLAHRRISTCYAHQSRFRTRRGARVERGQVIGHVGDSGSSTTSHLHFEVRRGKRPWGEALNPRRFLARGG